MDNELEARLQTLESHVVHLERQYEELNQVVIDQGRQLARLSAHLQRLGQTMETIELERIKSTDPKPPHYQ